MPAVRLAALLLCSCLGVLASAAGAHAATFDSLVNGAWDSVATWQVTSGTDADGLPDADDAVTVDRTVTVSTPGAAAQSITVATASVLAVTGATASLALGSGGGTLTGAVNVLNGGALSSSGPISHAGILRVQGTGAETVTNTGVWTIAATGSAVTVDNGIFTNAGTLRRDGGTGEVLFDAILSNSGAVEVVTGTLRLRSGSGGTGTHTIAEGATFAFSNNVYTVSGTGSVTGAGRVLSLGLGTAEATAGLTMGPDTTFAVGTLELDAGTVSLNAAASATTLLGDGGIRVGTGLLTVGAGPSRLAGARLSAAGTTTFAPAATLPISGGGVLNGHTLNLPNTTTLSGSLQVSGTGNELVNNPAAGTVTITNTGATLNTDNGTFVNAGTLRRAGGTGEALFTAGLSNSGTVEVATGTLRLRAGGGTGSHTIADGATLAFSHNLYAVSGAGSVTGAGRVLSLGLGTSQASAGLTMGPQTAFAVGTLELDAGTVTLDAAATVTALLGDGGTRAGGGRLTINGGPSRLDGLTRLAGAGTTVVTPGTAITLGVATVQDNHRLRLEGDRTFAPANLLATTGGEVENAGRLTLGSGAIGIAGALRNLPGAAILHDADTTVTLNQLRLRNEGELTIARGKLLSGEVVQAAGELRIGRRATLAVDLSLGLKVTGGIAIVGGTFSGPATVLGGALGGAGRIEGNLVNSGGTVSAGSSPGLLVVTGDFSQQAGGTLLVDVEGAIACSEHDRLDVAGTANLGGTIAIANDPGFRPSAGTVLRILNAARVLGAFARITGAGLGGGLAHDVSVKPDGIDLVTTAAAAVATVAPLARRESAAAAPDVAVPDVAIPVPAGPACGPRHITLTLTRSLARRARTVEIRVGRRLTRVSAARARSGVRLELPPGAVTVRLRVATRSGGVVHRSLTYPACRKAPA